ncbi:MAG: hypothetical protein R2856_02240 [Caldilineaceae bacterium]
MTIGGPGGVELLIAICGYLHERHRAFSFWDLIGAIPAGAGRRLEARKDSIPLHRFVAERAVALVIAAILIARLFQRRMNTT